jgi:hypothetical protein
MTESMVSLLRKGMLGVLLVGTAGNTVELALLEHYEDWRQWVPIALLTAVTAVAVPLLVRPSAGLIRTWQGLMGLCIAAGLAGLWFHYAGNVEFEIERTPELGGVDLFVAAMGGATPALAPGTMVQYGLLGLLAVWRQQHGTSPRTE